jgi:hypothetical protein
MESQQADVSLDFRSFFLKYPSRSDRAGIVLARLLREGRQLPERIVRDAHWSAKRMLIGRRILKLHECAVTRRDGRG